MATRSARCTLQASPRVTNVLAVMRGTGVDRRSYAGARLNYVVCEQRGAADRRLTKSVPCPADAWRRRQARLLIQRICRAVRPLRPSTEVFAEQAGNTRYPNVICLAVAQFT
jgi:hypothetical protein